MEKTKLPLVFFGKDIFIARCVCGSYLSIPLPKEERNDFNEPIIVHWSLSIDKRIPRLYECPECRRILDIEHALRMPFFEVPHKDTTSEIVKPYRLEGNPQPRHTELIVGGVFCDETKSGNFALKVNRYGLAPVVSQGFFTLNRKYDNIVVLQRSGGWYRLEEMAKPSGAVDWRVCRNMKNFPISAIREEAKVSVPNPHEAISRFNNWYGKEVLPSEVAYQGITMPALATAMHKAIVEDITGDSYRHVRDIMYDRDEASHFLQLKKKLPSVLSLYEKGVHPELALLSEIANKSRVRSVRQVINRQSASLLTSAKLVQLAKDLADAGIDINLINTFAKRVEVLMAGTDQNEAKRVLDNMHREIEGIDRVLEIIELYQMPERYRSYIFAGIAELDLEHRVRLFMDIHGLVMERLKFALDVSYVSFDDFVLPEGQRLLEETRIMVRRNTIHELHNLLIGITNRERVPWADNAEQRRARETARLTAEQKKIEEERQLRIKLFRYFDREFALGNEDIRLTMPEEYGKIGAQLELCVGGYGYTEGAVKRNHYIFVMYEGDQPAVCIQVHMDQEDAEYWEAIQKGEIEEEGSENHKYKKLVVIQAYQAHNQRLSTERNRRLFKWMKSRGIDSAYETFERRLE